MPPLRIGVFFDGGGCRGTIEIKQARALFEFLTKYNIPIENLTFGGISMGAILSAFLAQAHTWKEMFLLLDELDAMILKLNTLGPEIIFDITTKKIVYNSRHQKSILNPYKLYSLIDGQILESRPLDPKKIIASPIPLHILATNLKDHTQETFTTRQPRVIGRPHIIRDIVVASASLPPFFPATIIDGVRYRDGSRINLGSLIKAGCDIIFGLLTQPQPKDFSGNINDWYWWPWIPEIFEYMRGVGNGFDKSEWRLVMKNAKRIARDIKKLETLDNIEKKLVALHRFSSKQNKVREEINVLRQMLKEEVGDGHIAYPMPIYAPKLPATLRVENFIKEKVVPDDIRAKDGKLIRKKGEIVYEGDLKKAGRETYQFTKDFLSQVDLYDPEKIPQV